MHQCSSKKRYYQRKVKKLHTSKCQKKLTVFGNSFKGGEVKKIIKYILYMFYWKNKKKSLSQSQHDFNIFNKLNWKIRRNSY